VVGGDRAQHGRGDERRADQRVDQMTLLRCHLPGWGVGGVYGRSLLDLVGNRK
jgi:hypothetical protein